MARPKCARKQKPVVMISSTARDLPVHRKQVQDACVRAGCDYVWMETLPAADADAVEVSMQMVDDADFYVGIFAHRYGYVPAGSKISVTEMEYDRAVKNGIPRLLFFIDDAHPITIEMVENGDGAPKLKAFKERIGVERVGAFFKSAEELRTLVLHALQTAAPPPAARTSWTASVRYPLQPARHFRGRAELLAQLTNWASDPAHEHRVIALRAFGGTGKTALAERVVDSLRTCTAAGVFVWSFNENPKIEAFLREAVRYFTGSEFKGTGRLLARLQDALEGNVQHFLILDGLDSVQAAGNTGPLCGELEDPQLKTLLQWLATGQGTQTKALITSRYRLLDLADFKGFHDQLLPDLEPEAALAVLRAWGVRDDDTKPLREVLKPLQDESTGRAHALTVSVLGSYLGKLWDGDPTKAPTFDPAIMRRDDPKADKLVRILTSYNKQLPSAERDLLVRLAMFPHGVTIEIIGYLIAAGGEIAGELSGCNRAGLRVMLEGLHNLGLIYRYTTSEGDAFTAHASVRLFFQKLLGLPDPKPIYQTVAEKLTRTLSEEPSRFPTDRAMLDRYERLIEVTCWAGQIEKAFRLFESGLGGYDHLGKILGENTRGMRILSAFAANSTESWGASQTTRSEILFGVGLFAEKLGDLAVARRNFEAGAAALERPPDHAKLCMASQHLAFLDLLCARFPAAHENALSALSHAEQAGDDVAKKYAHAYLGAAAVGLGHLREARDHFSAATQLEDAPQLYCFRGIQEAELKLATGNRIEARAQTEANLLVCQRNHWIRDVAWCDVVLGHCALPDDLARAREHLNNARTYASRTEHVEVLLRCYLLAAEIARHENDYAPAEFGARDFGLREADEKGFTRWSIDLRLELARIFLAAKRPKDAVEPAVKALAMSEHSDCQYAWGIADGLHLLGVAHARLHDMARAREYLQRAVEKQRSLENPGLKDSQKELRRLAKS